MSRITLTVALAATLVALPFANASGLLPAPFQPILNGDFEIDTAVSSLAIAEPFVDRCIGVGHQAYVPLYSSWGDWVFASANDPDSVDPTSPAFVPQATGYPIQHATNAIIYPQTIVDCDPGYQDAAFVNPAEKIDDPGFMWSNDPGTTFGDFDADGDREVQIPRVRAEHDHNLWQSIATTSQAWSLDFDAFSFVLESGAIRPAANVQIGFSLTPGYEQNPWVGAFWEGGVLFRANDMVPDTNGRIAMDPVLAGEVICPGGYTPCEEFRAAYNAADEAGKRTMLGQLRIVQTSFWSFSGGVGPVVLDDIVFEGAKTAAETVPNVPNPGV